MKPKHLLRRYGAPVIVLLVSGAAFWPVAVTAPRGTALDATSCQAKLVGLKGAILHGREAQETFTIAELNTYLANILEKNPQAREPHGLTLGVEALRVDVDQGELRGIVVGRFTILPMVVQVELKVSESPHPPIVRSGTLRIGHLPLVPPLKNMVARQLGNLLHGLRDERLVIDHLTALEVDGTHIRVAVASTPKEPGSGE